MVSGPQGGGPATQPSGPDEGSRASGDPPATPGLQHGPSRTKGQGSAEQPSALSLGQWSPRVLAWGRGGEEVREVLFDRLLSTRGTTKSNACILLDRRGGISLVKVTQDCHRPLPGHHRKRQQNFSIDHSLSTTVYPPCSHMPTCM